MSNIGKKQLIFNVVIAVVIVSAILLFFIIIKNVLNHFAYKSALSEAKRSASQLLVTRSVISKIAPHIKVINSDISTFATTPAAVGVAISNKMQNENNYYIKQTTLDLRNPKNKPDNFEIKMLKELDNKNKNELAYRVNFNGVDSLRYGKALYIEKSCMRCHGTPYKDVPADIYKTLVDTYGDVSFNYKIGELRGMISIVIPMEIFKEEYSHLFNKILISSVIFLLILIILFYLHHRYIIQPQIKLLADSKNELIEIAFLDLLTNLKNRRAFHINIDKYILEKRNFWLLLLDLDGFKSVNDTLGHDAGDIVLKTFSNEISQINEHIELYRLGGDEFVMIAFNHNLKNEILKLTNDIIKKTNIPIDVGNNNIAKIGVSIGAAHYSTDAKNLEELMRHGDLAMYSAKESGKNQTILYDKQILQNINSLKQLENELYKAIENNELFLLYQPQYDYIKNEITGTEALLRWNHPTRGIISPDHFIAIAEENGFILEIGRWILFEATRQNKIWQDLGYKKIMISVNVTSAQLSDFGFLMSLIDVINETEIDPKYLEIEFIERDAISDDGNALEFMEQLKKFKISSAIDDFGTGYSSLSYLTKYPIKKIKIDKLFITDIHIHHGHQAIVKSIISLAKHLDMKILAEGVEKQKELDFLIKEGCSTIQGYLYSKPLSSNDMGILLKENKN